VFVFISHLTVPADDHDELERHFRERSGLVDGLPGFLYLQLLAPQSGTATHTFLTAWESRDDFRRYMQSEERARSHAREPGEIHAAHLRTARGVRSDPGFPEATRMDPMTADGGAATELLARKDSLAREATDALARCIRAGLGSLDERPAEP
jgi:heme-degrading monooxygenase HmoA